MRGLRLSSQAEAPNFDFDTDAWKVVRDTEGELELDVRVEALAKTMINAAAAPQHLQPHYAELIRSMSETFELEQLQQADRLASGQTDKIN